MRQARPSVAESWMNTGRRLEGGLPAGGAIAWRDLCRSIADSRSSAGAARVAACARWLRLSRALPDRRKRKPLYVSRCACARRWGYPRLRWGAGRLADAPFCGKPFRRKRAVSVPAVGVATPSRKKRLPRGATCLKGWCAGTRLPGQRCIAERSVAAGKRIVTNAAP